MVSCAPLAVWLLAAAHGAPTDMEDFIRRFDVDHDSISRYYPVPLSSKSRNRVLQFDQDTSKALEAIDFDRLDRDGKIDWIMTRHFLATEQERLKSQAQKDKETFRLLPFADEVVTLEEDRYILKALNFEATARQLDDLRDKVRTTRGTVQSALEKKEPGLASLALRASRSLSGLRGALGRWFNHYNGYKPDFSWWCKKPYDDLAKELDEYERFLRETVAGQRGEKDDPLVGDPIGRDALLRDLKMEMVDYTPEELIEIAQKEYDWCLKEMLKASREMGCGEDWKRAIEKTKGDHVAPGQQDDLIMSQGHEAVDFVEKHDLVSLDPLCKETWRVEMLTAEQQKNWPFAFYGGQHMATSYPLPEMDNDTKQMSMRGNNKHFMRAVTYHELIPGHHLQSYMSQRYRPYRGLFSTPFFIEGWALHWEMLMWDLGFGSTPENRVGMLFWRMHRCARIVVSLKFHLGQMSSQEMIDYLVDKVGHERWTATSEVRRYVGDMYSPLYQCAYLIGGLQLRAIYRDLVPKSMSPKQFHDAVLKLGPVPMEMVRASMTEGKLTKDFRPGKNVRQSW